ncbi:MAG TPA: alpha/beta fold hydrolase [Flavobacterium sp.]|jgi:pimeloyl-ACP methyl ester carboxylesterase
MLYSKIEGAGEPLLILHGFLGMSDNWKTLGTRYAAAGFQVHLPDMRNHGRSFHSDDFTYPAMVTDIEDYCKEHKLENVSMIGHSMGGKIAMNFAAKNPDMTKKLIIADIAPKYYRPHHDDIFEALNAVDFSKTTDRGEIEKMMMPFVPESSTRQFLMKSIYRKTPTELAFRFNLELFNKKEDAIGEALPQDARFEKSVLFLKGENSRYIKDEDADLILHHFPHAKIEVISNAGHWLHAENPDEFFEKSINYLKES